MSTAWFTADLHLGHEKVSEIRGFSSTDAHDLTILRHISMCVSKGDTLWILGDLSSGTKSAQLRALEILSNFAEEQKVKLHLISGNHDSVNPLHRNSHKWIDAYAQVFESVQPFARRRLGGRNLWVSHFPWRGAGDHTINERYETVRLGDDGTSWLLHGHTHSPTKVDADRRMVHVGLDAWGLHPLTIHDIECEIKDAEAELPRRKEQEADVSPAIWKPERRLKSCVEAWPECWTGEYNPSCCRFPKSCSCLSYPDDISPEHLEDP